MKDVAGCDKPRGAAKQALIRGCPNGETRSDVESERPVLNWTGTRGSETSQYPEEKIPKKLRFFQFLISIS